jgi:hypothetical protein
VHHGLPLLELAADSYQLQAEAMHLTGPAGGVQSPACRKREGRFPFKAEKTIGTWLKKV